jgi:hypothetical protein
MLQRYMRLSAAAKPESAEFHVQFVIAASRTSSIATHPRRLMAGLDGEERASLSAVSSALSTKSAPSTWRSILPNSNYNNRFSDDIFATVIEGV